MPAKRGLAENNCWVSTARKVPMNLGLGYVLLNQSVSGEKSFLSILRIDLFILFKNKMVP